MNTRLFTVIGIIVLAAISRYLPHPDNFTPLTAIALFSGAYVANRYLAIALPLLVMLLSDAMMGFNGWAFPEQTITVYGTFTLVALLGIALRPNKSFLRVGMSTLASSVFFFVATNFAVWLGGYFHTPPLYPMSAAGLADCFVMAIPFFKNTLTGDLFYSGVLFFGFYLLQVNIPALAEKRA